MAASDASIEDARKNFGDVEVLDRQRAKAEYLTVAGDREGALAAYAAISDKKSTTGQKIDMTMAKARLAMVACDWKEAKVLIAAAKA